MASKADELWEKYANDESSRGGPVMCVGDFLAALQEYGELVKAEAVKVCEGVTESTPYYLSQIHEGIDKCDAAIKEMKLP